LINKLKIFSYFFNIKKWLLNLLAKV
jgi:hypothetical protein